MLIGCCHLTAQASDTIRIVGTITDEQGEPIINAYIQAHDSIGNELSRGTVSDYDGKFYLFAVFRIQYISQTNLYKNMTSHSSSMITVGMM